MAEAQTKAEERVFEPVNPEPWCEAVLNSVIYQINPRVKPHKKVRKDVKDTSKVDASGLLESVVRSRLFELVGQPGGSGGWRHLWRNKYCQQIPVFMVPRILMWQSSRSYVVKEKHWLPSGAGAQSTGSQASTGISSGGDMLLFELPKDFFVVREDPTSGIEQYLKPKSETTDSSEAKVRVARSHRPDTSETTETEKEKPVMILDPSKFEVTQPVYGFRQYFLSDRHISVVGGQLSVSMVWEFKLKNSEDWRDGQEMVSVKFSQPNNSSSEGSTGQGSTGQGSTNQSPVTTWLWGGFGSKPKDNTQQAAQPSAGTGTESTPKPKFEFKGGNNECINGFGTNGNSTQSTDSTAAKRWGSDIVKCLMKSNESGSHSLLNDPWYSDYLGVWGFDTIYKPKYLTDMTIVQKPLQITGSEYEHTQIEGPEVLFDVGWGYTIFVVSSPDGEGGIYKNGYSVQNWSKHATPRSVSHSWKIARSPYSSYRYVDSAEKLKQTTNAYTANDVHQTKLAREIKYECGIGNENKIDEADLRDLFGLNDPHTKSWLKDMSPAVGVLWKHAVEHQIILPDFGRIVGYDSKIPNNVGTQTAQQPQAKDSQTSTQSSSPIKLGPKKYGRKVLLKKYQVDGCLNIMNARGLVESVKTGVVAQRVVYKQTLLNSQKNQHAASKGEFSYAESWASLKMLPKAQSYTIVWPEEKTVTDTKPKSLINVVVSGREMQNAVVKTESTTTNQTTTTINRISSVPVPIAFAIVQSATSGSPSYSSIKEIVIPSMLQRPNSLSLPVIVPAGSVHGNSGVAALKIVVEGSQTSESSVTTTTTTDKATTPPRILINLKYSSSLPEALPLEFFKQTCSDGNSNSSGWPFKTEMFFDVPCGEVVESRVFGHSKYFLKFQQFWQDGVNLGPQYILFHKSASKYPYGYLYPLSYIGAPIGVVSSLYGMRRYSNIGYSVGSSVASSVGI